MCEVTFGELKQRAALLCMMEGWDEHASRLDVGEVVNEAFLRFGWEAEFNMSEATFTTTAGQAEYTLAGAGWKHLVGATYEGAGLSLVSARYERDAHPLWLTYQNGTPNRLLMEDFGTVRLVPPPDTTGATVSVRGIREPSQMTADTDCSGLPAVYGEAVAVLAACLIAKAFVRTEADFTRIRWFMRQYRRFTADFRREGSQWRMAGAYVVRRARPVRKVRFR